MSNLVPSSILASVQRTQQHHQKVVLVTGVFDLLHKEHELFLRKAKAIGDLLVVALESDARVRQMKGEGRPVHSAQQRIAALRQLAVADEIFVLPDQFARPEDHEELIREIRPTFLAVSSHTAHQAEKCRILEKFGGEVRIVHEYNPAVSSTKILAVMRSNEKKTKKQ